MKQNTSELDLSQLFPPWEFSFGNDEVFETSKSQVGVMQYLLSLFM